MMYRHWFWLLILMVPLGSAFSAQNSEISVSYPPAVSLVRGTVEIRGTVALPDTVSYFVQVRLLDDTLAPANGPDALWSPATLPRQQAVTEGVLGSWNTTFINDGIYELELVVDLSEGSPERLRFGPVRVANDLPEDASGAVFSIDPETAPAQPTAGGSVRQVPTATRVVSQPGATATPDDNVTATATIQANVRLGDSTTYPAVGFLDVGETAPVLARSSRSQWLQIRLSDGQVGFISPSVVRVQGNSALLPRVDPPPLPVTPTPVPTVTPVASANLVIDSITLSPSQPVCNETFTITARVRNAGTAQTLSSVSLSVEDRHIASNSLTETTLGGVPALAPGATFNAVIPLTVDVFFEESHRLTLLVDNAGDVVESNEGDNSQSFDYTLARGSCG